MNQKHSQNIYYAIININFKAENEIQFKKGIINVGVRAKVQKNIIRAKRLHLESCYLSLWKW